MIRLEKINGKNVWDILRLRVSDSQKNYVAPNDTSIIEAYIAITRHGHAFPFGIYDGDMPVGFCMIGFGADDDWEDAPAVARDNYNLWRLMIDERCQGRGYGKAAMRLILDFIAGQPCGPAGYCWLSYEPENTAARSLYASFGFRETGDRDGDEVIAVLPLGQRDPKDRLIEQFAACSREILKDSLVGIYLHGSAAMGCFHPKKSDLDFLIVVREPMTDAVKRQFMDMTVRLDAEGPAKGIEMSIVQRDVCDPFVYPTPYLLHFSRPHTDQYRKDPDGYIRRMQGTDKDLAAHFTVIRSRGKCLYGLPVGEVFGAVPARDYMDSLWYDVSGAEEDIGDHPMYMILNLARVLAFARERAVLSKQEGGDWGLGNLPEEYLPLIRSALHEYGSGEDVQYDTEAAERYASYMLKQIASAWKAMPECPEEEKP